MTPEFFQRLLATEASAAKSRALYEELGSLSSSEAITALLRHPMLSRGERERAASASLTALRDALEAGTHLLWGDDLPPSLRRVEGTPAALFVRGDPKVLRAPSVGIVGTRKASVYGKACAMKFAEALARAGVTVISGGALGIDAAAHKGALKAHGKTAAVLPVGIDLVYPTIHRELFQEISGSGCLVSQFAAGGRPSGDYGFLVRNSLVAALSEAVLVVEAPHKSGALSTAQAAAEYGKEVFVVPSTIDQISFGGSFSLIRDGATLVTHPNEILESLGIEARVRAESIAPASSLGEQILACLTVQPIPAEKIVDLTGIDAATLLSELTMLELEGRILRDGGGYAIPP